MGEPLTYCCTFPSRIPSIQTLLHGNDGSKKEQGEESEVSDERVLARKDVSILGNREQEMTEHGTHEVRVGYAKVSPDLSVIDEGEECHICYDWSAVD